MYILHAHRSNTDKIVASFVTTFFLIALYFFLGAAGLPDVKLKTETYDEINWTRFKPKPKTIVDKPKVAPQPQPLKIERPPQPQPKPAPVAKVDLSSLKNSTLETLTSPRDHLQQNKISKPGPASKQEVKIDLKNSSVLSGSKSLFGDSTTKLQLPNQRGNRGGRDHSTALTVGASTALGESEKNNYGGGPNLNAPAGKNVQGDAPLIALKDLADFGSGYSDLSPIYHELIEWMKRNPAPFPQVVKRFMEYSPGDLTSIVSFQIGGRSFQMFLLCKENLFEVRICLLEGSESTYLIDRGFKEKSSFLRVGGVNVDDRGGILSFETVREAASNSRTQQFYQIFLSWWESVKSQ